MSDPATPPDAGPGRVLVPRELAHLLPLFLASRRTRLEQARAACQAGDLTVLRSIGHDFKGTCGGYGFRWLSRQGAALEQATTLAAAATLVGGMADHLARVAVEYVDA
jgi:HPt (histidine-containing phosphotransfer) domain-containing protein